MQNDYKKECVYLGSSDIAALTITGCTTDGVKADILHFGGDGSYSAYVLRNNNHLIPSHYKLVMSFKFFCNFYDKENVATPAQLNTWIKIFDDQGMTAEFKAKEINIYRAGDFGCIISLTD